MCTQVGMSWYVTIWTEIGKAEKERESFRWIHRCFMNSLGKCPTTYHSTHHQWNVHHYMHCCLISSRASLIGWSCCVHWLPGYDFCHWRGQEDILMWIFKYKAIWASHNLTSRPGERAQRRLTVTILDGHKTRHMVSQVAMPSEGVSEWPESEWCQSTLHATYIHKNNYTQIFERGQ